MNLEQYLKKRYAELLEKERNAWANLGQAIGAREEVETLLDELEKGEVKASPEPFQNEQNITIPKDNDN